MKDLYIISSITEAHAALGLPKPTHPLVSVSNPKDIQLDPDALGKRFRVDLFQVWMKDGKECEIGYGRNSYDFGEGTLAFMKEGQVLSATPSDPSEAKDGHLLLFHPDLIRKSELGKHIHQYSFFDYEVFEALHVSEEERVLLSEILSKIQREIHQNIDKHSQKLIISNIELFLDYCTRYYDRQFYTRTNLHQDWITKFDKTLRDYFEQDLQLKQGLPTVKFCGEAMNMSPNYLSDLLRKETGKTTQEHIHYFVVERAKNLLLGSNQSVAQVAYELGFEYPQHFAKLFKSKTGMSPVNFKQSV
jgi:AraC-like DNA-binding protein